MLNSVLNYLVRALGGQLIERLVVVLTQKLSDWLVERAIKNIETQDDTFDLERYYLLKKVRGAKTNEERKILSITLARLSRYELPNSDGEGHSSL